MSDLFKYDAVTAKCRCIIGQLLTKEQYMNLISSRTLADAVAYLKDETAYADLLDSVEPSRAHRAHLEQLLENNLLDAYIKLYTFTSGAERRFIGHLMEELELRYLLDAIRATEYDDSMEFYSIPQFIRDHAAIDFKRIFRTSSSAEMLEALKGSEYFDTLYPIMSGDKWSFADVEAALVHSYYKKLITKYASVFSGDQKKRVQAMISEKIDLLNISVILRMRRFNALREGSERVKLDFTTVMPKLIPISGRLREPDVIALCSEELSLDETIERFAALYKKPGKLFAEQNATGEYGSEYLFGQARRLAANPHPSFDVVLGCLSLIKFETDNLIYILEALRYGVAADKIEQSIIV